MFVRFSRYKHTYLHSFPQSPLNSRALESLREFPGMLETRMKDIWGWEPCPDIGELGLLLPWVSGLRFSLTLRTHVRVREIPHILSLWAALSSRVRHKTIFGGNLMSISQLPQGSSHGWGGGTRGLSSVREEMAEDIRIEWPSLKSGKRFKSAAIILRGKRVLKPDRWCSPRKQKVTWWLTLSSCTWEYDFKSYAELKQRVLYEHIGVMTAFSPGY